MKNYWRVDRIPPVGTKKNPIYNLAVIDSKHKDINNFLAIFEDVRKESQRNMIYYMVDQHNKEIDNLNADNKRWKEKYYELRSKF